MDYEQKYKEALERAKKLQETCNSTAVVGWCEYIFPELVESEDERIRKELIDYFSSSHATDTFRGISWDRIVAWLEKQGEQTKIEALRTEYEKGKADTLSEMKSSWSEEDKKMLDAIIDFFENGTVKLQHDLSLYASWLKSLKPQSHWKPTKEQMYMLEWLTTNVLDDGVVGKKAKEVLNTLIEQLKSL